MKRSVRIAILLIGVLAVAQGQKSKFGTPSPQPPGGTVSTLPRPCTGTQTVLLIQDVIPWAAGAGQDSSGANVKDRKSVV